MRAIGPCLGWAGVRDQLRALASRQREGGWQALAVLTTTPDWAAAPAGGCERPGTRARNRPPRADALPAYRQLIVDVLAAAARGGRRPALLERLERAEPPRVRQPAARHLRPRLAEHGARRLRASSRARSPRRSPRRPATSSSCSARPPGYLKLHALRHEHVPEFIAGLPQDVVCASTVWSQHAYIGGDDPVDAAATRARRPRLPAAAHGLDHRDRRRPQHPRTCPPRTRSPTRRTAAVPSTSASSAGGTTRA